jgi:hypothetical protein
MTTEETKPQMRLSEALYAIAERATFGTEEQYREVLATIERHADHIDRVAPESKPGPVDDDGDGDGDGEPDDSGVSEVTGNGDKDLTAAEKSAKPAAPTRRR